MRPSGNKAPDTPMPHATFRRARQAGEDDVDDVLRQVMLAARDEDLFAVDLVCPISLPLRASLQLHQRPWR